MVYILTEERWGADAGVVRIGVYSSRALAIEAAEAIQQSGEKPGDPENFSFLLEAEELVRKTSPSFVPLEAPKAWRWWPSLAPEFAAV